MSRDVSLMTGNCADVLSEKVPIWPPWAPPWLIQMRFWSLPASPPSANTRSRSPSESTSPKSAFSDLELLADPPGVVWAVTSL